MCRGSYMDIMATSYNSSDSSLDYNGNKLVGDPSRHMGITNAVFGNRTLLSAAAALSAAQVSSAQPTYLVAQFVGALDSETLRPHCACARELLHCAAVVDTHVCGCGSVALWCAVLLGSAGGDRREGDRCAAAAAEASDAQRAVGHSPALGRPTGIRARQQPRVAAPDCEAGRVFTPLSELL